MGETLSEDSAQEVRSDFLVFGSPDLQRPEIDEVVATLESHWIGMGPRCIRFEELFRQYIGCAHAVSVNSCTAGLELALDVLQIGPGDEVITTPLTFCATANVIVHRGARPVFVDVDAETGNIDPECVRRAISPRTKAILPVHLYGRPCEMDPLLALARERGLAIVEDAAHAIEARYRGRKVGAIGDMSVFSFYVTKNMTTAEGGMLTTENPVWADTVRVKRLHGISHDAWKRYSSEGFQPYDVLAAGYKFNMTDLQAALGIHQLARLEANLAIREQYWRVYDEGFSEMPEVQIPPRMPEEPVESGSRHARHLYTLILNTPPSPLSRWEFVEALKAENIGTGVHFVALHLTTYYREAFGYKRGDFPNAESISDRTVSLPLSPALTEEDLRDVIRAVKKVLRPMAVAAP
jgi:dTDP-4-amino-4,6-dideoxygalactose transaminase